MGVPASILGADMARGLAGQACTENRASAGGKVRFEIASSTGANLSREIGLS